MLLESIRILVDYLERRGSEVVNMLTAEYDYDMDIMVKKEEAREEGRQEGREVKNPPAICWRIFLLYH